MTHFTIQPKKSYFNCQIFHRNHLSRLLAAKILGQIERSDFITRPLLSDYENILCRHPLADEVCVGVDEVDNPVVVFGVLIADAS